MLTRARTCTAVFLTLLLTGGACLAQAPVSVPVLPAPSGPHHVGTLSFYFVDSMRVDPVLNQPGQFRELNVQVWYPATGTEASAPAAYMPGAALLEAMQAADYYGQSDTQVAAWQHVQTHARMGAPPLPDRRPLLLFSHGLGVARFHYTALMQELASHGYLVAAIDHPYGGMTALPDGRILSPAADPGNLEDPAVIASRTGTWAADAAAVLDQLLTPGGALGQFAGRIDTAQVGMLGHSLGGAAALEACLTDARIKACADLDGAPFGRVEQEGLRRPTLAMASGPDYTDEDLAALGRTREQWERMGEQYKAIWTSIFSINPNVPGYLVGIRGTGHMSYSDAPFVMPETLTRFGGNLIAPQRGFEIMSAYLRAFFDQYLQGQASELFAGPVAHYPEVSIDLFNE